MKRVKGSYTVEASLIMGICMILLLQVVNVAIQLQQETVRVSQIEEDSFVQEKTFRRIQMIKMMGDTVVEEISDRGGL